MKLRRLLAFSARIWLKGNWIGWQNIYASMLLLKTNQPILKWEKPPDWWTSALATLFAKVPPPHQCFIGLQLRNQVLFFKGKTGDWKNHISPELNKRVDEWIAKNLAGSDLQFVTELDKQDWIYSACILARSNLINIVFHHTAIHF